MMDFNNSDSDGENQIDLNDCAEIIDINDAMNQNDIELNNIQYDLEDIDIDENNNLKSEDTIDALVLPKHIKPIFNIDICLEHNLIITGGEDDVAYLWYIASLSSSDSLPNSSYYIIPIKGHTDSVIFAKFNFSCDFVATADMAGNVIIHQVKDIVKKIKEHVNIPQQDLNQNYIFLDDPYSVQETSDLSWVEWHPNFNKVFVVGTESGDVYIIKFERNSLNQCKILSHGQNQKSSVGKIVNTNILICGYDNGDIKLWDMKIGSCRYTISNLIFLKNLSDISDNLRSYHKSEITCLEIYQGNLPNSNHSSESHLILSSSIDGEIKLFDLKDGKYLADYKNDHNIIISDIVETKLDDTQQKSIESLSFNGVNKDIFFAANLEGDIFIWDFAKRRIRHTCHSNAGIVKAIWSLKDPHTIVSAHLDGSIKFWNSTDGTLTKSLQIHQDAILDFVFSKDESYLATASEDTRAKIIDTHAIM